MLIATKIMGLCGLVVSLLFSIGLPRFSVLQAGNRAWERGKLNKNFVMVVYLHVAARHVHELAFPVNICAT